MNRLHTLDCIDFIDRFKPTVHPENASLMMIDLRLPRDVMQDVCLALTESGLRHYLAGGGTVICFDKLAYDLLKQQCEGLAQHHKDTIALPMAAVA
jgi:hypothetical protein